MRRSNRSTSMIDERGTASIEFIAATVLLLVPVLYLVISLAQIQNQSLGVEAASRHLARAYAQGYGPERAERVLAAISEQYGLAEADLRVATTCVPAGGACPRAGVIVAVTVDARAAVPLLPRALMDGGIPIGATSVHKVSEFAGER